MTDCPRCPPPVCLCPHPFVSRSFVGWKRKFEVKPLEVPYYPSWTSAGGPASVHEADLYRIVRGGYGMGKSAYLARVEQYMAQLGRAVDAGLACAWSPELRHKCPDCDVMIKPDRRDVRMREVFLCPIWKRSPIGEWS